MKLMNLLLLLNETWKPVESSEAYEFESSAFKSTDGLSENFHSPEI